MEGKASNKRTLRRAPGTMAMLITVALLVSACAISRKPMEQRRFDSAQQAVEALVAAVQGNDDAELLAILGPGSEDLISSGDKVADSNGRARFSKAYAARHSLVPQDADRVTLLVGTRDYPFPIPVVREGDGAWHFDTPAGMEEILNRRIGRNELHTIEVMQAYTQAQREYAGIKRNGGSEFAQRLSSSPGKRDGLYWQAGEGEQESPFGPLIAKATEERYTAGLSEDSPEPFHGYYFKILKAQGAHADGGAFDYVADGKMILGFALVAYPAKYGASGIMTFIVNQEGVIYQKDLGEDTATVAAGMTTFDPDSTWHKYEEPAG